MIQLFSIQYAVIVLHVCFHVITSVVHVVTVLTLKLLAFIVHSFYRTQVYLGSDLWVQVSLTHSLTKFG